MGPRALWFRLQEFAALDFRLYGFGGRGLGF